MRQIETTLPEMAYCYGAGLTEFPLVDFYDTHGKRWGGAILNRTPHGIKWLPRVVRAVIERQRAVWIHMTFPMKLGAKQLVVFHRCVEKYQWLY